MVLLLKKILAVVSSVLFMSLLSSIAVAAVIGYRQGEFETSGISDPGRLKFTNVAEVVDVLEGDPGAGARSRHNGQGRAVSIQLLGSPDRATLDQAR
ncbi:hypothetical protein, partial [Nocardiopsis metallicus]|uniref:hypothetical protein n=1 Tax=Nocardiopsis metallicus TaxID=179819 RepID=UPI0031DDB3E6